MIEWPLVFLAGVLGSSHCVGMCGGFALALGAGSSGLLANARRQLAYTAGRVFTYAALGAVTGFAGWRLVRAAPALVNVPAILSILAGLLLIHQGFTAALARRRVASKSGPCFSGSMLGALLAAPGWTNALVAGLFTGFLPCGLLYGMLALAASSRSMVGGLGLMILFGIGTAPVMMATGLGGSLISLAARRRVFQIAAWCVVAAGLISVARGVSFVTFDSAAAPPVEARCPLCP